MSKALFLGMVAVVLACAGITPAYPTISGPSGMSYIPTGKIAPTGIELAADWHKLDVGDSIPFRVLLSVGRGIEVGASYDPFSSKAVSNPAWGVNAKGSFLRFFGGESALGVQFRRERGARDDFFASNTDFIQGYFAWTTDFSAETVDYSNIAITLGTNWTRVKPFEGQEEFAVRGFAGATIFLTRDISLMAEYQTKNAKVGDADPVTSVAARYRFNPDVSAQVGMTNGIGLSGTTDHTIFAGIDLTMPVQGE